MKNKITISIAKECDIESIFMLYKNENWLGKNQDLSITKNIWKQLDSNTMLLVAKVKNIPGRGEYVVGSVIAYINQAIAFDCKKFLTFDYLVVKEGFRKKGIGRALINYLIDYAKRNDLESIWFCSSANKKEAHQFYEIMGFDDPVRGFRKTF